MTSGLNSLEEAPIERIQLPGKTLVSFPGEGARSVLSNDVLDHLQAKRPTLEQSVSVAEPTMSTVSTALIDEEASPITIQNAHSIEVERIKIRYDEFDAVPTCIADSIIAALSECASGTLSSNMTLFRLFCDAPSAAIATQAMELAIGKTEGIKRRRLLDARSLWHETPKAFELVQNVLQKYTTVLEAAPGGNPVSALANAYESILQISPEGSVALYSLGRDDILKQATEEVVEFLKDEGLLGGERCAVEIGCGTGRFLSALAPCLKSITGLDISESMLGHAVDKCRDLTNVEILLTDGYKFDLAPERKFDFVIAVDSFPYIFEAGDKAVLDNVREAKRVLRPGGRFLIFNFSSRGDDERDRQDIHTLADRFGFKVLRSGDRPFQFWDGVVFDLESAV